MFEVLLAVLVVLLAERALDIDAELVMDMGLDIDAELDVALELGVDIDPYVNAGAEKEPKPAMKLNAGVDIDPGTEPELSVIFIPADDAGLTEAPKVDERTTQHLPRSERYCWSTTIRNLLEYYLRLGTSQG